MFDPGENQILQALMGFRLGRILIYLGKFAFGVITILNAGLLLLFDFGFVCTLSSQIYDIKLFQLSLAFLITFISSLFLGYLGISCIRDVVEVTIKAVNGVRSPSSFVVLGTAMAIVFAILGIGWGFVKH